MSSDHVGNGAREDVHHRLVRYATKHFSMLPALTTSGNAEPRTPKGPTPTQKLCLLGRLLGMADG